MGDNTALGDRMKRYEASTRILLPRRTYTIIRVDGKAFHTFCRGYDKPFDWNMHSAMETVALALCKELQGSLFSYCQSDECSVVLMDFGRISSGAAYDGNLQKLASIAASIATASFNKWIRVGNSSENRLAHFDGRAFTIPDPTEVENYFIWRQKDATRNSISAAAQSVYSAKELHGKKSDELQEMLWLKGINWNDYPVWAKRGQMAVGGSLIDPPVFTQDREFLTSLIPTYDQCE